MARTSIVEECRSTDVILTEAGKNRNMSSNLASALREAHKRLADYDSALRDFQRGVGSEQEQRDRAKRSIVMLGKALLIMRDVDELLEIDRAAVAYIRGLVNIGAFGSSEVKDARMIINGIAFRMGVELVAP